MKKVLLIGAGGFIGSHLAAALLKKKGYEITASDISNEKLIEGISNGKIRYAKLDIMKKSNDRILGKLIRENDIVVDMAAICNPSFYIKRPVETFELDFQANLKVAQMCLKHKKRLIQFSTCEVYGKSPSVYAKGKKFYFDEEKSNMIHGPVSMHRWIYAASKQLLERVIHAYGLKYNFDYSIIRPFNYIGQRIDYLPSKKEGNPRVFSHFMDNLMLGKPLCLVNGGKQRRCYTYIKDATDAHVRIIENRNNRCSRQIFNVGNPENETTIRNLAFQMRRIYKKHFMRKGQRLSRITSMPGEKFYGKGYDDSDRRLPNIEKLKKLTGWNPKYSLNEMLCEIMQYYVEKSRQNDKKTKVSC